MKFTKISAISLVLVMSSSAAFANVKQVNCEKFIIAVSDDIAAAAEKQAGSMTAAEEKICEAAMQISFAGGDPEVHEIVILPYNISTTVVMLPKAD
ncbi:hypothetical protein [Salipiger mangrovisoli]|uniref:HdeA/HdeB family protein n=1 Tax=Salipiger mangrovisoli TaxID=2865933 RepID=A0ABR9WWP0_9RHOB|nr:hypothetical protein [Salipiger mangrovisoli]MBE9635677.1 hypothetical protein [Salipiger mangrovisoli]